MLSLEEVFDLLAEAPSKLDCLRLAARLRKAAKEGRKMKDGRTLVAETVDQAVDAFLQASRGLAPEMPESEPEATFEETKEQQQERQEQQDQPAANAIRVRKERRWCRWRGEFVVNKRNLVERVFCADSPGLVPRIRSDTEANSWLRMPMVIVNGMTNSGKSTLINKLLGWKSAARASSRPGKTTSVNFYLVNRAFVLVDLPGYPDPDRVDHMRLMEMWDKTWEDLVNTLLDRGLSKELNIRLVLHMQDVTRRTWPSFMCRQFVRTIKEHNYPMIVLMSKDDELEGDFHKRKYLTDRIRLALNLRGMHLHWTMDQSLSNGRKARRSLRRWIQTAVSVKSNEELHSLMGTAWENREAAVIERQLKEARQQKFLELQIEKGLLPPGTTEVDAITLRDLTPARRQLQKRTFYKFTNFDRYYKVKAKRRSKSARKRMERTRRS